MIWRVLTEAGYKAGLTATANIRIGQREWINDSKMTMPGRLRLQRLLHQMVAAGCQYAVIETSSEGIKQYRHWGIRYQVAVLTNLSEEHIEAHGSYENYKAAKGEFFKKLTGQAISILNVDDEAAEYFKTLPARQYIYYSLNKPSDLQAVNIEELAKGFSFEVKGHRFKLSLLGKFNISNAMAAIAVAKSQDINWQDISQAIGDIKYLPGRMEEIKSPLGFEVIVDYAHTPDSLQAVYETLRPRAKKLIAVLGAAGGGRDKAKRAKLGRLAGQYADIIIITNEDPYDEDPQEIIDQVWQGLVGFNKEKYKIIDRRQAIRQAIVSAQAGDIVVITGKGSEQCIVTDRGKIKWDDRLVAKEIIND